MKNVLFKDTVTVTELKGPGGNEMLGQLTGQEALRVLHRDKAIKVVITEEFYLSLLNHWNSGAEARPSSMPLEEMKRVAREELASMMGKLQKEPEDDDKAKAARHG